MATPLRDSAITSNASAQQRCKVSKHFNSFLILYKREQRNALLSTTLEDCKEEEVDKRLLDYYVGYLQDKCGAYNTAKNYFSATKTALVKHFPSLETLFTAHNTRWQLNIRNFFQTQCSAKRIPLVQHHIPLKYDDLQYICNELFCQNMHEEAALLSLDWMNCGRISEGPGLLWTDLKLVEEYATTVVKCCIQLHWFHGKTSTLSAPYNFLGVNWQSCIFHCLARLVIITRRNDRHLFPQAQYWNVISHINNTLKSVYQTWSARHELELAQRKEQENRDVYFTNPLYEMCDNLTSHGTRAGSVQHCRCVGIVDAVLEERMGNSSGGRTIASYSSISWEGDAKV